MLMKKKIDDKIDYKKANEVLTLWSKILKIVYVLVFILGVYAITLIAQAWHLVPAITGFLKIMAPLFIGIMFAWLMDPLADYLNKRGINRNWGTAAIIICFISIIILILAAFLPLMRDQINNFVEMMPTLIDTLNNWVNNFFSGLDVNNATAIQDRFGEALQNFGDKISADLPVMTINFVTAFFAGLGTFLVGLIIGFFLLLHFDKVHGSFTEFLPARHRDIYTKIAAEMNTSLRNFVNGMLLSSSIVFIASLLGFMLVGLESPLLFALICGITNLIPYIGPYIGGIPAVVVGFTINPTVGLFTLIIVVVVQFLESFIINPMIMSKAVKLHPVTIILGLLVFGSYFGIWGVLLATPIIAVGKIVLTFLMEKYNFFNWNEIE